MSDTTTDHIILIDGREHMQDAQGRLVPVANIRPVDQARDALVREKAARIDKLQATMRALKVELFADVDAFVELSLERYGVTTGGRKGNVSLSTFDGSLEIRRQISEHITFDEGLQAAKALIDECLKDWSRGGTADLRTLVNDAFQVDKTGRINTGRILALRRYDIKDERWLKAMQAIGDSVRICGSKPYIRLYRRNALGKMDAVSLDFAAL